MSGFDITEISVCTTCAHLAANGEYNDGEDTAEQCWAGQQKIWGDNSRYFTLGSTCEESPCPHHKDEDDCTVLEQGFSWSDCEGCGSWLGGDRFLCYVMVPKV